MKAYHSDLLKKIRAPDLRLYAASNCGQQGSEFLGLAAKVNAIRINCKNWPLGLTPRVDG